MLTKAQTLGHLAADLDHALAREKADHRPLGALIGMAHRSVHEMAAQICHDANWPPEYRFSLVQEIARALVPTVAPYGITEAQMLEVRPAKPAELIRHHEISHLGDKEKAELREYLGPETATRLLDRIQKESIEAVYGMTRRATIFNKFDSAGKEVECPEVSDAVLHGLNARNPDNVPPAMARLAQTLLQLNQAQRNHPGGDYVPHPSLPEFKDQLETFYRAHETDFLPYAIHNGEHAGQLLFWDHEKHFPPVKPETWAQTRETICRVAGDARLREAEQEILQIGLDRLEMAADGPARALVVAKLRTALGDHIPPEVVTVLKNPLPANITSAKLSLGLPVEEDAAVSRDSLFESVMTSLSALRLSGPAVAEFREMAATFLDADNFPQVSKGLQQLRALTTDATRLQVEKMILNDLPEIFAPGTKWGDSDFLEKIDPAPAHDSADVNTLRRGHHRNSLHPHASSFGGRDGAGDGFPR